jgi:phosphatidylglycerophosphate synthase
VTSYDEDRARLEAAVKANDGFFTTFFVSPYSKYVVRFAARHGWTPNAVTLVSFAIGLAAAASFAAGMRWASILGAILLQVSFTADCVDGQLARYTKRFSSLGGWLDSVLDRTKEHLVYAGLALGAARGYDEDVWLLAAAALALLTFRHMSDFGFAAARGGASPEETRRTGWRVWAARFVGFPIGERFLLISLTASIATPRVTFIALLAWGGLATAYALTRRVQVGGARLTTRGVYRDDGPLAGWIAKQVGGELSWLAVPLVRAVEYAFPATLTAIADPDALPACFAFLAVVAFHQYDTVYRLQQRRTAPPAWVGALGGGWEGRTLLISALALAGALRIGLIVAAVALAILFAAETFRSWTRFERGRPSAAPGRKVRVEDAG